MLASIFSVIVGEIRLTEVPSSVNMEKPETSNEMTGINTRVPTITFQPCFASTALSGGPPTALGIAVTGLRSSAGAGWRQRLLEPVCVTASAYVPFYLGSLLFSLTFLDAATPLDSRIISPVPISSMVLIFSPR